MSENKMGENITLKIKANTEGFEDVLQEVEALAEAYDGFPAQITIKNCKLCTFNIYPSQTKIINATQEDENEKDQMSI